MMTMRDSFAAESHAWARAFGGGEKSAGRMMSGGGERSAERISD
jgi:hypothetical protein